MPHILNFHILSVKTTFIRLVLCFFIFNCASKKSSNYIHIQDSKKNKKGWQLIWEDNFNKTTLDTTKWTKIPQGKSDWNDQMTDEYPECFDFNDKEGHIHLKGIVNNDTLKDPRPFLTGGIYSKGKFAFQYGKIEIRAKLEAARGAWPAMWMLSESNTYGGWPKSGEIDIMEHLNFDSIVYQTTHSHYTKVLAKGTDHPYYTKANFKPNDFNTFGLEWYPDKLVFTLNGKTTFEYPKLKNVDASQWPYDKPFYILIDQQLGGSWVGKVNTKDLPVSMIVDWVRVYQ